MSDVVTPFSSPAQSTESNPVAPPSERLPSAVQGVVIKSPGLFPATGARVSYDSSADTQSSSTEQIGSASTGSSTPTRVTAFRRLSPSEYRPLVFMSSAATQTEPPYVHPACQAEPAPVPAPAGAPIERPHTANGRWMTRKDRLQLRKW